jgi:hypothetical protein
MNGDQSQSMLSVSSAERIINRIPVSIDVFRDRLGVLQKCDGAQQCPPFRGNWRKFGKNSQKNQLRASLRHWIDKLGQAKCLLAGQTNPSSQSLYQAYMQRAQKDLDLDPLCYSTLRRSWSQESRGYLVDTLSSSALNVYHQGILIQGSALYNRNASKMDSTIMFETASNLYDQLWWFRTIQGLAVPRSFGFCVHLTERDLTITLMILEIPCTHGLGERYSLYENTQTFLTATPLDGKVVFRDLGVFLLQVACLQNPFVSVNKLEEHSPGLMLLHHTFPQGSCTLPSVDVLPTITGSLVLRCYDIGAFVEFVRRVELSCKRPTTKAWYEAIKVALQDEILSDEKSIWYIKVKTPVFGQFWDTATAAINCTRNLLQTRIQKVSSREEKVVIRHWLQMHPVDSLIEAHRTVTILPDAGIPFCGQLAFHDFKEEFLSLVQRTLTFQFISNLCHGDIHDGNILLQERSSRTLRLNLIDWDEALRPKPCLRIIANDKDRRRYPNSLVDFPELYTKYQLLSTFEDFWNNFYSSVDDSMIQRHQKEWQIFMEKAMRAHWQGISYRDIVDSKFTELCKCLIR